MINTVIKFNKEQNELEKQVFDLAQDLEIKEKFISKENNLKEDLKLEERYKEIIKFQEIKMWRLNRLKTMYARRLNTYDKSKLKAEPYKNRKEILEQMEIIRQMAEETKKAERKYFINWLETGDLEDVKSKGLRYFLQNNFSRMIK